MAYLLVCTVALTAAALTLFSGFGLGTLLMPAFALFFPITIAIAATAVVHLANNLFKLILVGRAADWRTVLRFSLPAIISAIVGAWTLSLLTGVPPLARYSIGSRTAEVTPVKLILAAIIAGFALLELSPRFQRLAFPPRWIPLGGLISGFFGGLSGHQGALRSAFLIRAGLSKEAFIGTGVACAVIVDLARLAMYAGEFAGQLGALREHNLLNLILAATLAAFVGSFVGARLVPKVTMRTVRLIVAGMLLLIAAALAAGII